MMSKRSKQDKHYCDQGFCGIAIRETPEWTEHDRRAWANLEREIMASTNERLKKTLTLVSGESIYQKLSRERLQMLQFVAERAAAILDDWPDEAFFKKADLLEEYQGCIDFIIHDGGEIREDVAYEDDDETVKVGWSIMYWK